MKNILLFFCFIFISFYLFSLDNDQIELLAIQKFSGKNSFNLVLRSADIGKWFELESALWIDKYMPKESVVGFELAFEILNNSFASFGSDDKFCQVLLPSGRLFELRTTEFDVVSTNLVIESKGVIHGERVKVKQLIKEKNFLEWLGVVFAEYKIHGVSFARIEGEFRNCPVLKVCGQATSGKNIFLRCNWIRGNYSSEKDLLEKWFKLIEDISQKNLIVFFKNYVPDEFRSKLVMEGIPMIDSIDYDI